MGIRFPLFPRALLPPAIALFVLFASFFRINSPDLGWHIGNGAHIWETKRLHFADPFSHTTEGRSYPPTQWLFEVGVHLLESRSGAAGLIVAKGLLLAILFLLLGRLLLREGASASWAALLLLAGVALTRFRFILRPDLISLLFLAITLSILYDFRRRRRDRLFLLPILFLVWVQCHSGALFGLILLGATWTGEVIAAGIAPGAGVLDGAARKRLLFWTAVAALCTIVNPNHLRYATFAIGHVEDYAKFGIQELRPLLWERDRFLLLYIGLTGGAMAVARRRDPPALLAILLFGVATIRTVRLFPFFLILSLPYWAGAIRIGRPAGERLFRVVAAIAALALFVGGVHRFGPWNENDRYRFGVGVNDRLLPVAGADALARIDPAGNLFNSNLYGGYLIWRFDGERPVFTDGRSQLHESTLAFIAEHGWREIFERYGIGHALIDHRWGSPAVPGDEMALVWWDDLSLLFITRAEAEKRGIPIYTVPYPVADRASIFGASRERVEAELARAAREAPRAVLPRAMLASLYALRDEWAGADSLLRQAIEITPWRGDLRVERGIALARLGRREEAIDELRRGLGSDEENARGWGSLGNLLYAEGVGAEAERAFRKAMEHGAEDPSYGLALGRIYEWEGEAERAARLYHELEERFPKNAEIRERRERLARPAP